VTKLSRKRKKPHLQKMRLCLHLQDYASKTRLVEYPHGASNSRQIPRQIKGFARWTTRNPTQLAAASPWMPTCGN
jgi:hypothetical protein